jgi:membrane fusion protein
MNRPLFREEAIANKSRKLHGPVLLTRTWSNTTLAILLCVIVASLIAFALFFGFARKATVTGIVVLDKGINRILSPQSGTIEKLNAVEGQEVKIGDPLFTISSERSAENGAVQATVKESLVARIDKLHREQHQVGGQSANKQRELADKLASVNASLKQIDHELALQRDKVHIARDVSARVAELAKTGNISKIVAADKEADLLEQRGRLSSLEIHRQSMLRELASLQSSQTDSAIQKSRDVSTIQREIEDLKQQLAENEAKRQIILRAELDGRLAAVLVESGQSVVSNQRIASILPKGNKLEAELYMPSRNVGTVTPNTRVVLRYDAFPYQKFGQFNGFVRDVSETSISAADLPQSGGGQAIPDNYFRVRVSLEKQEVILRDKRYQLKPGMQLSANVLLEERTIFEWMFEPLFGMTARN